MQCNDSWLKINKTDDILDFSASEPQQNSRLEIINNTPLPQNQINSQLKQVLR